jgi:hypothetical protein
MSNLRRLYKKRLAVGLRRQPSYRNELMGLHASLKAIRDNVSNLPLSHPFRLKNHQMQELMRNMDYARGGRGEPANPRSCAYLYRITGIRKVVEHTTWSHLPNRFPNRNHPDSKIFECIMDEYAIRGNRWLPLADYAKGNLGAKRKFTWWTNMLISNANVVCDAHTLGKVNYSIPKYALVLRVSVEAVRRLGLAYVPTPMDAFTSEIFHPADFGVGPGSPDSGRTIDLEKRGPLVQGEEEYALRDVPVQEIEFYPVLIDRALRSRHVVKRNAKLWQLLEIYYNTL